MLNYIENNKNSNAVNIILSFYYSEIENDEYSYDIISELLKRLRFKRDENAYDFLYDGFNELYEHLYSSLSIIDRSIVKQEMFGHIDVYPKFYTGVFNKDFQSWMSWQAGLLGAELKIKAFRELIGTHIKWITANNIIVFHGKYSLDIPCENATWSDIYEELRKIEI